MTLKYGCFISYPHVTDPEIIRNFEAELLRELNMWNLQGLQKPVYRDETRLKGGAFFNAALARALCESVCMIAVYIPGYFNAKRIDCGREYRAMEKLERRRLQSLNRKLSKENGLIIPIIFRGSDEIPEEILSRRHCYNFEPITMKTRRLGTPQARAYFSEIARYVRDRYNEIKSVKISCVKPSLPSDGEVLPWLKRVQRVERRFPR